MYSLVFGTICSLRINTDYHEFKGEVKSHANFRRKFEEELKNKMFLAKKECKYNPTRFNQMLARHGGVKTAKQLIANAKRTGSVSEGFATLILCGRLDLSMEDSVCKSEYRDLFSDDEISYCEELLGRK